MYVERLLQINIAVLVCLATLLIGVGQHDAALPLVMFFVAIASLWLNDYTKWIAMNRTITGAGQVAAMVFAMASLEWDRNSLILALGQVLVYWQFIILFQKKDARTYWHQAQLSLLQVVVAALLTQEFVFGLLLIAYLLVALSALTLMFLNEERNRYHRTERKAPASAPAIGDLRWPLAQQEPSFSSPITGRLGVNREIFGRLLKTAAASLVVSILVFLFVPRQGHGAWRGPGRGWPATVGFNDRVRLGSLSPNPAKPAKGPRHRFLHRRRAGGNVGTRLPGQQ